ncbi:MAG: alpha/beta hydrolase [Erysipelotrichaceae bacterium]|nr:alpha/beta hydrolase [Erysipelotrichaceae bacterium]
MKRRNLYIKAGDRNMKTIVLQPEKREGRLPGILWIHGGGYMLGMASMVGFSCGKLLAERYGGIVFSPAYTLANRAPYPAALHDCYAALEYMWDHAGELGIDQNKIIVGGESAGGGLAAALCIYARDQGKVKIAMHLPLYPMIDCYDTESSRNNRGKIWNTRRNHWGWRKYLGDLYGKEVPSYASAARAEDYSGLPYCYTYVCDGEPFYQETIDYVENLRRDGVEADIDIYHGDVHAFDLLCFWTDQAKTAKEKLCQIYSSHIDLI